MTNEAALNRKLVATLRTELPDSVVFKHADRITSGVPDFSVTWNCRTSWFETKYANPGFASKGIQEITMRQLSRTGLARYVIFSERPERRTLIVLPTDLRFWQDSKVWWPGFNHLAVVDYIRRLHENAA